MSATISKSIKLQHYFIKLAFTGSSPHFRKSYTRLRTLFIIPMHSECLCPPVVCRSNLLGHPPKTFWRFFEQFANYCVALSSRSQRPELYLRALSMAVFPTTAGRCSSLLLLFASLRHTLHTLASSSPWCGWMEWCVCVRAPPNT